MSDETQTAEAAAESTEQAAPAADYSNIEEVIDGRLGAFEQSIQQALQARQEPQAPEDPYQDVYGYADALGLNVPAAQQQEDDTATLQALADMGDQRAQRIIEERVSPELNEVRRELGEMRAERAMESLKQQYPKLSDPKVEQAVAEQLQPIMQNFPPGTPATKELVALAYRAWEADQMATDEGSIGQSGPQLENPAGAGPEGSQQTWSERQLGQSAPSKGASFWGFQ